MPDSPMHDGLNVAAAVASDCQEESLRTGFEEHLTKPVEPEDLVRAIRNTLQRRKS